MIIEQSFVAYADSNAMHDGANIHGRRVSTQFSFSFF